MGARHCTKPSLGSVLGSRICYVRRWLFLLVLFFLSVTRSGTGSGPKGTHRSSVRIVAHLVDLQEHTVVTLSTD